MSKRVIILAGGKGTRLRPYTTVLPKPLMPIGDYPILEVIIRQLANYKFTHITMAVNHQADLLNAFFGNGEKWGVKIDYSLEDQPLSTIGPLRLIKDLPENFLIMNGDVLTDLNFELFFEEHLKRKGLFTIASAKRENKIDYGVLKVNEANTLTGFIEKPNHHYEVSMGVYAANIKILDVIPANQPYGLDHLMLDLLEMKKEIKIHPFAGYWLDIGRPDDYEQAIEEFDKYKDKLFLK